MDLHTFTPDELERIGTDLRTARGHVAAGWTQRRLFRMALGDQLTRVCALGAIAASCHQGNIDGWLGAADWGAHTNDVIMVLLPHVLQDYTEMLVPSDVEDAKQLIALLNDGKSTTQEQVLTWFDRAITEVEGLLPEKPLLDVLIDRVLEACPG